MLYGKPKEVICKFLFNSRKLYIDDNKWSNSYPEKYNIDNEIDKIIGDIKLKTLKIKLLNYSHQRLINIINLHSISSINFKIVHNFWLWSTICNKEIQRNLVNETNTTKEDIITIILISKLNNDNLDKFKQNLEGLYAPKLGISNINEWSKKEQHINFIMNNWKDSKNTDLPPPRNKCIRNKWKENTKNFDDYKEQKFNFKEKNSCRKKNKFSMFDQDGEGKYNDTTFDFSISLYCTNNQSEQKKSNRLIKIRYKYTRDIDSTDLLTCVFKKILNIIETNQNIAQTLTQKLREYKTNLDINDQELNDLFSSFSTYQNKDMNKLLALFYNIWVCCLQCVINNDKNKDLKLNITWDQLQLIDQKCDPIIREVLQLAGFINNDEINLGNCIVKKQEDDGKIQLKIDQLRLALKGIQNNIGKFNKDSKLRKQKYTRLHAELLAQLNALEMNIQNINITQVNNLELPINNLGIDVISDLQKQTQALIDDCEEGKEIKSSSSNDASLKKELATLKKQLEECERKRQQLTTNLNQKDQQLDQKDQELGQKDQELGQKDQEIQELQQEIQQLTDEIQTLKESKEGEEDPSEELKQQIKDCNTKLDEANRKLKQCLQDKKNLEIKISSDENKIIKDYSNFQQKVIKEYNLVYNKLEAGDIKTKLNKFFTGNCGDDKCGKVVKSEKNLNKLKKDWGILYKQAQAEVKSLDKKKEQEEAAAKKRQEDDAARKKKEQEEAAEKKQEEAAKKKEQQEESGGSSSESELKGWRKELEPLRKQVVERLKNIPKKISNYKEYTDYHSNKTILNFRKLLVQLKNKKNNSKVKIVVTKELSSFNFTYTKVPSPFDTMYDMYLIGGQNNQKGDKKDDQEQKEEQLEENLDSDSEEEDAEFPDPYSFKFNFCDDVDDFKFNPNTEYNLYSIKTLLTKLKFKPKSLTIKFSEEIKKNLQCIFIKVLIYLHNNKVINTKINNYKNKLEELKINNLVNNKIFTTTLDDNNNYIDNINFLFSLYLNLTYIFKTTSIGSLDKKDNFIENKNIKIINIEQQSVYTELLDFNYYKNIISRKNITDQNIIDTVDFFISTQKELLNIFKQIGINADVENSSKILDIRKAASIFKKKYPDKTLDQIVNDMLKDEKKYSVPIYELEDVDDIDSLTPDDKLKIKKILFPPGTSIDEDKKQNEQKDQEEEEEEQDEEEEDIIGEDEIPEEFKENKDLEDKISKFCTEL